MARIPLPSPDELDPAQRLVYDKVVSGPRGRLRGPLRAALYNPALADYWQCRAVTRMASSDKAGGNCV